MPRSKRVLHNVPLVAFLWLSYRSWATGFWNRLARRMKAVRRAFEIYLSYNTCTFQRFQAISLWSMSGMFRSLLMHNTCPVLELLPNDSTTPIQSMNVSKKTLNKKVQSEQKGSQPPFVHLFQVRNVTIQKSTLQTLTHPSPFPTSLQPSP